MYIELYNNKDSDIYNKWLTKYLTMQNVLRWCSNQLDGAVSFRELLGERKVMQIRQGEITHEVCFLSAQLINFKSIVR